MNKILLKEIEKNNEKTEMIDEINDLYTRLDNYLTAFDWSINYHNEHLTNSETGKVDKYHENCLEELKDRVALREDIVKTIIDALYWQYN